MGERTMMDVKESLSGSGMKRGLAPIVDEESEVLILGSLPGEESLAKQEYYAKPANRFWRVLSVLKGVETPVDYPEKLEFLKTHHIALWDVIKQANREGSMDSDIRNEEVNDIAALLRRYPKIRVIAFNGKKAVKTFDRYVGRLEVDRDVRLLSLLSTSPANAQYSLENLVENWKGIYSQEI